MVAQHFAVVGCEDSQTVVETTGILDEATDLVVYKVDHAVISRARTAHVVFVEGYLPGIGVETLLGTVVFECPVSDDWIGQVPLDIAVVIEGRWGKRGMGVDQGYVEKKWDCGIAFLEKVHCSIDTPEGMHLFFRQMMWATNPSVGGNTVGHAGVYFIAVVVLLKPFDIVVVVAPGGVGQLHVVEAIALSFGG